MTREVVYQALLPVLQELDRLGVPDNETLLGMALCISLLWLLLSLRTRRQLESKLLLFGTVVPTLEGEEGADMSGGGLAAPIVLKPRHSGVAEKSKGDDTILPLATKIRSSREGFFGRLKEFFQGERISPELLGELEALLVQSDLGADLARELIDALRVDAVSIGDLTLERALSVIRTQMARILATPLPRPLLLQLGSKPRESSEGVGRPHIVMLVGINGVGKTTTAAKCAYHWKSQGARVLLVAADTFRAAAVAQLAEWARRIEVDLYAGAESSKPSTVVFDGLEKGIREKYDIVLIDTAGRLNNKSNLMQELVGVKNTITRKLGERLSSDHTPPPQPDEVILVVDGTTGQNALSQAREFHQALALTGIVVTKLDGTAKGGALVAIVRELQVPVRAIGVGESFHELRDFNADEFLDALLAAPDVHYEAQTSQVVSVHAEARKRRRRV